MLMIRLKCCVSKEIPIYFHNASNYDYHFIIKQLAEEFDCLGENTERHNFLVPTEKQAKRIYKNGEKMTGTISYKLQFIDSARFMASSLSNLVRNLAERIVNVRTVIHVVLNTKTLKMI